MSIRRLLRPLAFGTLLLSVTCGVARAEEPPARDPSEIVRLDGVPTRPRSPDERRPLARGHLAVGVEATYLRQFGTHIGPANRFAADRFLTRVNLRYGITDKIPLPLSIGYRLDAYDFSGGGSAGGLPGLPWNRIHSPRITLPFIVPLGERWIVGGGATLRSTVEEGVPLEDGVTGGGFVGAGYKVNECLTIGPGFGILTELEDDPSYFPIVLVEWKIRPDLTLSTGRGLGSTQGPGLFLEWRKNSRWSFSVGGRYERLRFRLDDRGAAPGGIGEETSYAGVAFARYKASRKLSVIASAGANFAGTLRLEDRGGNRLFSDSYDSAVLAGLGFTLDL